MERFWKFVNKKEENECWEWIGGRDDHGYGNFQLGPKCCVKAHRFSYDLNVGEIPHGLMILHKCDNPTCVNPNHLMMGTMKDNVHDMLAKGRDAMIGDRRPGAILTTAEVEEIRILKKTWC